jgi:hypothetical protein
LASSHSLITEGAIVTRTIRLMVWQLLQRFIEDVKNMAWFIWHCL